MNGGGEVQVLQRLNSAMCAVLIAHISVKKNKAKYYIFGCVDSDIHIHPSALTLYAKHYILGGHCTQVLLQTSLVLSGHRLKQIKR